MSHNEPQLSFATAPALYAALWLAAGILLARYWILPGTAIVATLLLSLVSLVATHKATRLALLPLACTWMLLGLVLRETERGPDPQTQLSHIADAGGVTTIEGTVTRTTPVRVTESSLPFGGGTREEQSQSLDLRVMSANGRPVTGGLRATVYGPANRRFPALHCGDQVHASVAMHLPERYLDPGVWDATAWLRQQGIGVVGSLKVSALTHQTGHASFACWLHSAQQAGSQRLIDFASASTTSWVRLNHDDAGMLSAMILGDRTYLDHQARIGFERTGSFHLLVVSGMHLAIFAGCIFGLAGILRLPRAWSTAVTILCALAYALLAGFGEPVQRSFWMVTLYLLARLLFRERNSLNAVGIAAGCLLAVDPGSLAGASFQMTLLSVLIVAGVAVPIAEHTFSPYLHAARHVGLIAIDPTLPPREAQLRVTLRLLSTHLQPFLGWRFARFLPPAVVRFTLRSCELLLVSGLIELAMSLPMAIYFHRVTALGLPVNLLVVPLIGLALPCALITFATLLVWPSMAIVPGAATAALLHTINGIVGYFSTLGAGDIRLSTPGAWTIVAGVLLIGLAVWAAGNSRFAVGLSKNRSAGAESPGLVRPFAARLKAVPCYKAKVLGVFHRLGWAPRPMIPRSKNMSLDSCYPTQAKSFSWPVITFPIAALACSAACVFYPRALDFRPGVLEVTAIDVGQGDSLLLISPQGKTLLIDAGGPTGGVQAAHGNFEIGEDVVSPVLWSRHIRRLDAIALTHAHSDHMGGMPSVLTNFRPRVLWVGNNPRIPAYAALLAEAHRLGIPVQAMAAGERFAFGGTLVEVLAPAAGYVPGPAATNDDSLVLHVAFGKTSVLLEGDAQYASEQHMLSEEIHSDLLKVGHHGSNTSTTPRFFAAVAPRYAVISVAHHNPYGHPKLEVLDRLQDNHVRTFRTDALGATSFYLDGSTVTVQPWSAK